MNHTLLYDITREDWTRVENQMRLEREALAARPAVSLSARIASLGQRLVHPAAEPVQARPARRIVSSS